MLPDIEITSARVHEAWMESKRAQGVTSRKAEDGEELMVPYEQLSEKAKQLDRGTVQAVYAAIGVPSETRWIDFAKATPPFNARAGYVTRTVLVKVGDETHAAYLHTNGWVYDAGDEGLIARWKQEAVDFPDCVKFPAASGWMELPK